VFSGEIPTDQTSLYHNNLPTSGFIPVNQDLPPVGNEDNASINGNKLLPSTSLNGAMNTAPWLYEDGTLGTIKIHKLNKTIKVYEGESLDNMRKGIGHFSSTSSWDGNVGLAGHNRGASAYFSFVKDLTTGDQITYTTKYGTRTYEVFIKERINENDFSPLRWTSDNILTLITCVENVPSLRWYVAAREV
jgi:sortase A